jgi:hypothetical protein
MAEPKRGEGYSIRRRDRVNSSPPEGMRQEWTEYQVVSRTKIIGRFDLLSQALRDYPGAQPDHTVIHEEKIASKQRR